MFRPEPMFSVLTCMFGVQKNGPISRGLHWNHCTDVSNKLFNFIRKRMTSHPLRIRSYYPLQNMQVLKAPSFKGLRTWALVECKIYR